LKSCAGQILLYNPTPRFKALVTW